MKTYRWNAEEYARNSTAQLAWARELIGKLALRGTERVLDIGCGDGKITAELSRLVPGGEVVGIDNSEDMIRKAAAAFPAGSLPNLSFQLMDASSLSFAAAFDVAFSNAVLHWVKDHRTMLRSVADSLKPSGRLLFQMGGRGNGADMFSVVGDMIGRDPWRRHFQGFEFPWGFYGPEEYGGWLKEAGLSAHRIELIPRDMRHKGKEGLLGWVKTTWMPYTERVPEALRETFLSEAVDRSIARRPLTKEGQAVVPMVRLEVEAEKVLL